MDQPEHVYPERPIVSIVNSNGKTFTTISYYFTFLLLGLVASSLGPTLPDLAKNTQSSLSEISSLFIARSLGALSGSLLGGRLFDRVHGHWLMIAMLIIMAALLVYVPSIFWLGIMFFIFLFMGFAWTALNVGANTLIVWIYGRQVGPFINALHFSFGVGAFLSPIIIAQIIVTGNVIAWTYWTLAVLAVPVIILLLLSPVPITHHSFENTTSKPGHTKNWLLVLIVIILALDVGAEVSFGSWIFTYIIKRGMASETTAAYITSAFWGALTLGRLVLIPLVTRVRPMSILFGNLIGGIVSMSIILVWFDALAAVWIGTLMLGFSMSSIFPVTISLAQKYMTITGRITGWFFFGASLGGMTLPWIIGQFFETIGPHILILVIIVDLIISVGVLGMLNRRTLHTIVSFF